MDQPYLEIQQVLTKTIPAWWGISSTGAFSVSIYDIIRGIPSLIGFPLINHSFWGTPPNMSKPPHDVSLLRRIFSEPTDTSLRSLGSSEEELQAKSFGKELSRQEFDSLLASRQIWAGQPEDISAKSTHFGQGYLG